jgi:hypothetical protein
MHKTKASVHMYPDEIEQARKQAKKERLTLSEWIRKTILEAINQK